MIYSKVHHNTLKHRIRRFLVGGENFKKEVKKEVRLLIFFTFGFTIAFSWRQTIFDGTENLIHHFLTNISSTSLSLLTSVSITIISLIVIWLASKWFMEKPEYYED